MLRTYIWTKLTHTWTHCHWSSHMHVTHVFSRLSHSPASMALGTLKEIQKWKQYPLPCLVVVSVILELLTAARNSRVLL